ncbi:fimbria/pilus outer membrane usher protein [Escherichia coli]
MSSDGRRWSGEQFPGFGSTTPFLTRQGQVRYKLAAGQPRPSMSHQTENETFFSNEVSWGDAVKHLAVRRPAAFW